MTCFPSGSTGTVRCFADGVNGICMVLSAGEVSFFADCPTTTWFPLGPVKVVPAGPLCAGPLGADALCVDEAEAVELVES